MTCPSSHELSAAFSEGACPAHVASCAACTAEWNATRELVALARELGPELPSPARREEVRTTLLAAGRSADVLARPPRRRPLAYVGALAAIAVAAIVLVVVIGRDPTPIAGHAHATVRPLAGARFTATHRMPDEIIELADGTIDVEVAPLHAGERFRVVLADAEIEVHGTRFVATARAGKLAGVDVTHGLVEVRPRAGAAVLLRVGESWRAPAPKVAVAPVVEPDVEPPPPPTRPRIVKAKPPMPTPAPAVPAAPPAPPPAPVDGARERIERLPQERAYDDGWAAMRSSRFADAAAAFARVQLLDPDGTLAEDATYWYAVALARANEATRAMTAFDDYLDRYPRSRRAGEASTMLGWLLVSAKQHAEAARRFRAATSDPNPAVRESAKSGLDAVSSRP